MVLGDTLDIEASYTQLSNALGEALDRVIHEGLTLRDATCAAEVIYDEGVLRAEAAELECVFRITAQSSISLKLEIGSG